MLIDPNCQLIPGANESSKIVPYEFIMSKESKFDNEEFAGRERILLHITLNIKKQEHAIQEHYLAKLFDSAVTGSRGQVQFAANVINKMNDAI
jgi:hypothetical protein